MKINEEIVRSVLGNMLNECLESANQEYSFQIKKVDLENMKFSVDFNIVIVEEDGYIGFNGY